MSRHCASMCFASHRIILDLILNMWYMWCICTLSALLLCFWRHHWCIWVWCPPSWKGFSYSLSMETDAWRLLEWMTMSPKVKAEESRSSTFHTFVSQMSKNRLSYCRVRKQIQNMTCFVQRSVPSMPGPLSAGYDSHVVLLRTSLGKAGVWFVDIRSKGYEGVKLWSSRLLPCCFCKAESLELLSTRVPRLPCAEIQGEAVDIVLRLVQKTKHALVRPPSSWGLTTSRTLSHLYYFVFISVFFIMFIEFVCFHIFHALVCPCAASRRLWGGEWEAQPEKPWPSWPSRPYFANGNEAN